MYLSNIELKIGIPMSLHCKIVYDKKMIRTLSLLFNGQEIYLKKAKKRHNN